MKIRNEFYLRYHRPPRKAIKASVYLGARVVYQDGRRIERPRWTHKQFEVVGRKGDFVLLRGIHGIFGRRREAVKLVA